MNNVVDHQLIVVTIFEQRRCAKMWWVLSRISAAILCTNSVSIEQSHHLSMLLRCEDRLIKTGLLSDSGLLCIWADCASILTAISASFAITVPFFT